MFRLFNLHFILFCFVAFQFNLYSSSAKDIDEAQTIILNGIAEISNNLKYSNIFIKDGVQNGELNELMSPDRIGGRNFNQARELLLKSFNLAEVIDLKNKDAALFNKVISDLMIYEIRTSSDYDHILTLVQSKYPDGLPADATIQYLFGLAYFRQAELTNDPKLYDKALPYLNDALKLNSEFPEAYWLRSQIYAAKRQTELAAKNIQMARNNITKFSPKLYLYDMRIIGMIKDALKSQ